MSKEKSTLPVKLREELTKSNLTDLTKAEKIASGYAPFMNDVTEQMQLLKKLKKGNEEDSVKAKRIRIDLGTICSKVTTQKKTDKDFLLLETRFIDSLYNVVNSAARITQGEAKEIEDHFENLETERINTLQSERFDLCKPFVESEEMILSNLGTLPESIWNNYIAGLESSYKSRKEAEKKAEELRIETDRIIKLRWERSELIKPYYDFFNDDGTIKLGEISIDEFNVVLSGLKKQKETHEKEQETIRIENDRLKKEAEEKVKKDEADKKERERLAKIEADKLANEAKKRQERNTKRDAELKPYISFIRCYANLLDSNEEGYQKEFAEIKKSAELQWDADKKEAEDKANKERLEKQERDRLALELKNKQDLEDAEKKLVEDAKAKALEAERLAKLAPEKDKITAWIDSFSISDIDSTEFSASGKAIVNTIQQKFEAFKKWSDSQKESIK